MREGNLNSLFSLQPGVMYVVNSYLHVLKNIDTSWGDPNSPSSSKKSSRRRKSRFSSRKSRKNSHAYSSSSESGLYSEEFVNSGYYGDDEVERCRCKRCVSEVRARKPKLDLAADYDIISVDLSACSTPKQEPILYRPREQTNFDEYIIIPSSKEEFISGEPAHSTPLEGAKTGDFNISAGPPVRVDIQNALNKCLSCTLLEDTESDSLSPKRRPLPLQRISNNGSGVCWWRENIVWQLKQRNDAETKRFSQLQAEGQRCRAKVRINRELADYLNKYGELSHPNEPSVSTTASLSMEVESIDRSELALAIRSHGTSSFLADEVDAERRVRTDSIAHLASTYLNRQRTLAEEKQTESEDSYSPGCEKSRMSTKFVKRAAGKKWRENIVNQLQMRNFLECKYFTDALVRRTMSQLSTSEKVLPTHGRGLEEYDIISEEEVSSLDSASTVMNSTHSTSLSQGYSSAPFSSRFFRRKRK